MFDQIRDQRRVFDRPHAMPKAFRFERPDRPPDAFRPDGFPCVRIAVQSARQSSLEGILE